MATVTIPITQRDGILKFDDGGSNTMTVFMEKGDVSWTTGTPEAAYYLDRASISDGDTRDGDDKPLTVSFSFALTDPSSSAYQVLTDWITRPTGSWAKTNLASSLGTGREDRINIKFTVLGANRGGVADKTATFSHFKGNITIKEGSPFTEVSVSGTCKSTQPTWA